MYSVKYQRPHKPFSRADSNDDSVLSEREFLALPNDYGGGDEEEGVANVDWRAKRKHEFRTMLDTNHDGLATKDELIVSNISYCLYSTQKLELF